MKTLYIIVLITSFVSAAISQTDSVVITEDLSITYFRSFMNKIVDKDTIHQFVPDEITEVESVTFLGNDSLIVKNEEDLTLKLNLVQVRELKRYSERINTFLAAGFGAALSDLKLMT